ncbi:unnamed protein product [Phyllotreta striolata]|uniref:Malate dehydrogenase n=1 Tax=Phyllotreta striolata TaxID=444603 RepID=A0A9N9TYA0_PHYSR|nr:unnamed protein product [Phyllotreta striolata]
MFSKNIKTFTFLFSSSTKSARCCERDFIRKMSLSPNKDERPKITPLKESRRFMIDCLKAVGAQQKHAEIVADNLLEADHRGHYSHGMNRLENYINDVEKGFSVANATPTIEKETTATAVVNANNGFGAVSGQFCMDLAIKKAEEAGIGIVTSHNANHYGIAGIYCLQALKKGLIGFSCTNTSPLMVPTRAKKAALGTNPIALGVPGLQGDDFLLDFATTAVAVGKIEIQQRKHQPIPEGWALNENGRVETDSTKAFAASRLLPLGGVEKTSGYKGYGLGMLVEIFCGILSGSSYGPNIRSWTNPNAKANLGHCFMALDPKAFAEGVEERMSDLMNTIRNMEPVDPSLPVLVHGDAERNHMEKVQKLGGLSYVYNQHETNKRLAERLNVAPMQSI